jgi:hypothetical protein
MSWQSKATLSTSIPLCQTRGRKALFKTSSNVWQLAKPVTALILFCPMSVASVFFAGFCMCSISFKMENYASRPPAMRIATDCENASNPALVARFYMLDAPAL